MKKFLAALVLALLLFVAAAQELPSDGTVLITAEDGTIVGIGKVVDGEEFELELLIDFSGFGTLVFTAPDGSTQILEVLIDEGVVSVDLVDLETVLAEAGFAEISITADDNLAGKPEHAGKPQDVGKPDDAGRPDNAGGEDQGPNEHADENANEGAGNAGQGQDNADENAGEGAGNAGQGSDNADDNAGGAGGPDEGDGDEANDDEGDAETSEGQNPGYGPGNNPGNGGRP